MSSLVRGPADAFVMYWDEGKSKINKPWNRQGGGVFVWHMREGEGVG